MKNTKTKPVFGEWTSIEYPPELGKSVIVCREGQGISFEAARYKDKETKKVFWSNAVWGHNPHNPITGLTHWMPMPPAYGLKQR